MGDICHQFKYPGDLGEVNPAQITAFNALAWTPEDEPVYNATHNDNFKPKIVPAEVIKDNETEFDNNSIISVNKGTINSRPHSPRKKSRKLVTGESSDLDFRKSGARLSIAMMNNDLN